MRCLLVINEEISKESLQLRELMYYYKKSDCVYSSLEIISIKGNNVQGAVDRLEKLDLKDSVLFLSGDSFGQELSVRLSIRKNGVSMARIEQVSCSEDGKLVLEKRIGSGNLMGRYEVTELPLFISVMHLGFYVEQENMKIETIKSTEIILDDICGLEVIKEIELEVENGIGEAEKLVVLGAGIKKPEEVELFRKFVEGIGAKLAGTRPVVMQGLLPMNCLIGVSGIVVNPKLCITIGVSGMAGFYAGIENSEHIIAINRDKDALIVNRANEVVIADWKNISCFTEGK